MPEGVTDVITPLSDMSQDPEITAFLHSLILSRASASRHPALTQLPRHLLTSFSTTPLTTAS